MKILVTGGAGFIGANLLYLLSTTRPDDEIVTIDSLTYAGHRESIRSLEDSGRVKFVKGDIRSKKDVERAMKDAHTVVHLAAETHVDRSIADAAPFLETNVLGTWVLLEAGRKMDVKRFHLVSTDEVYGSLPLEPKELKFTLSTPYAPKSPYAASKAAADHLARAYFNTYGVPLTISNCSNNYGPYQHPEKLIPLAITNLLGGKKVPLYGDGLNVRDWIYVEDHCRAIDLIMSKGVFGETYLVGAGNELSNVEVLRAILRLLRKDEGMIEHVPDRPGHDRRYAIDPTHIQEKLGWKPMFTFEESLARTVDWYVKNQDWWRPIQKS